MTRWGVKLSSRFARMGAAIFAGLIGAYVTARLDIAIRGPCVPSTDGSLVCIPPDPNWILAVGVGFLVAAFAWLALSRFQGSISNHGNGPGVPDQPNGARG
jgi:hypothetical protein